MIDTKDVFIINMLYLLYKYSLSFGILFLDPESMSNFQYKKHPFYSIDHISFSISPRNPLVWANPVIPGFINVSS
jgi:hypothetical protein